MLYLPKPDTTTTSEFRKLSTFFFILLEKVFLRLEGRELTLKLKRSVGSRETERDEELYEKNKNNNEHLHHFHTYLNNN